MASTIKTRIQLKYDTENNWNKAIHFVPLRGEVIIYAADDLTPFSRIKVGDGTTPVVDLPFITAHCMDGGGGGGGGEGATVAYHTTEYWAQRARYVPQRGEILVYSDKNQVERDGQIFNEPALKIGDGTTYLVDLPFVNESMYDDLSAHIRNTDVHVSPEQKAFLDNKLNCENTIEQENLILNRW